MKCNNYQKIFEESRDIKEFNKNYQQAELDFEKMLNIQKRDKRFQEQNNIKKYLPSVVTVGGYGKYYQLVKSPNNKNQKDISPPITFQFYSTPILSFSIYNFHTVLITSGGLLKGIGNNIYGQISSYLPKTVIDHFTEFSIKDKNGHKLNPISALCYSFGTFYMFSKKNGKRSQLVLCDSGINEGTPVYLKFSEVIEFRSKEIV